MVNFNIPILMYHSIESMPKSTSMRSLHVPPKRFRLQMWILKVLGYKALSLKELKPYLIGEKSGKVVGLTFDDGYKNNLTNALPILKKYNFSATCFIVTDHIGSSNLWDRKKGIIQMPLMNIDDINIWLDSGMDIGSHTQTHPDLTSLSQKELMLEVSECKAYLEKQFKTKIEFFCYPFGIYNESICEIVKESGYFSALTMIRGRVNLKSDKFRLPRIPINHHTLPHLFLTKILTSYEDKKIE